MFGIALLLPLSLRSFDSRRLELPWEGRLPSLIHREDLAQQRVIRSTVGDPRAVSVKRRATRGTGMEHLLGAA